MADSAARAVVVVPAHDEAATIGRLLQALVPGTAGAGGLRVIVVANGCTDDTAERARQHGVEVLERAEPSKQEAMRAGAAAAEPDLPLVFVDADVLIDRDDVLTLVRRLEDHGLLAAAPRRELDLGGAAPLVRSYYRVWSALPQVESGLFGRGVVAVSPEGRRRVADLPMFMSDDLALSECFAPGEREVVQDATVRVVGPRTVADLLRRRQRIIAGNREFDAQASGRERTGLGSLARLVRQRPRLLPHVLTFVAVTVVGRIAVRLRRGDVPWLRDESSRTPET